MVELDESFTSSLQIGPTRHLPAHLQKRLCKALACVPLAAAKLAARRMSCEAQNKSRDIKFSSIGPADKSRCIVGNIAGRKSLLAGFPKVSKNSAIVQMVQPLARLRPSSRTKTRHVSGLLECISDVGSGAYQLTTSSTSGFFG
jgi:hypothetical protein